MTKEPYDVADAGTVVLEVTFGDGQLGSCTIRLDGRELAEGSERVRAGLGSGAELRGKTVRVFGNINRTSPSPRCSVTYRLSGGAKEASFGGDANFDVDGEPVDVRASFTFV